jgi:hypothetical protein
MGSLYTLITALQLGGFKRMTRRKGFEGRLIIDNKHKASHQIA